jgi:hypothetical protein
MSNPKKHHYIPKSYLRNFAERRTDVDWVDTLLNRKESEIKQVSTTNLCHQKNLYTFPPGQTKDPYVLEKYYGEHVDGVYPEVYSMLTNPEIINFSVDEKRKVLNTTLSLYFRTPGFLNKNLKLVDNIFDKVGLSTSDPEQMVSIDWGNGIVSFNRKDLDLVREEQKVILKQLFLIGHFQDWKLFVNHKLPCGIAIFTVPDDIPLITSDNPISIIDLGGRHNPENIFDVENIIEFAINPRTYVVIMPNSISKDSNGFIQRADRDKYFAAGINNTTSKTSQHYLIAYPGDLQKHLDSQTALGANTPENWQQVENTKKMAINAKDLLSLIQTRGTIYHKDVINKVKEIQATGIVNNDKTMEAIINELKIKGLF